MAPSFAKVWGTINVRSCIRSEIWTLDRCKMSVMLNHKGYLTKCELPNDEFIVQV